jgi:acyl carrier protein
MTGRSEPRSEGGAVPEQQEIFDRVVNVITATIKVDRGKVTPASRFVEDLNADSLDMLTLLMQLEDEFKSKIPDEDAKGLTTVQAVLDYLAARGA